MSPHPAALVGRDDEASRLDAAIDRAGAGASAAIAVLGEPGIGKSSLLAELTRKADARRWLALGSAASEFDCDVPFAVFVEALDAYLGSLEVHRVDAIDPEVLDDVASVFPSLGRSVRRPGLGDPSDRYRTNRAIRTLLASLAATQPIVLVLDDLHWSDPASVDLVATLLHKPPVAPLLLAIGVRPRQMPVRLVSALDRAVREGSVDRIDLGALVRTDIEALLGDDVARSEIERIYEDSGGNPFYARQLARVAAREASTERAVPQGALGELEVPAVVIAALAEELELLGASARRVVDGAAVAGEPFDPELVAAAAGADDATVMAALDELLRLDIVRPTDVPRRFRFRHPLVRRAIYESTPIAWRLGAHERCAEALTTRGAPASARAHHVERAGRHGDPGAIETLREAGAITMRHAPSSAARWYEVALRFLPAGAPTADRLGLLTSRARALAATGQFDESRAALIECIDLSSPEDTAQRAQMIAECALVEHLLGRHVEAHERMSRALAALDGRDAADAVPLMIALAVDSLYANDYAALQEMLASVLDTADAASDAGVIAAVRAVEALAGAMEGRIAPAVDRCHEAAALVDSMTDEQLAPRLDAVVHLTTAEMYLDRYDASLRHAERALSIGRATGQVDLYPLIFPMLGTALWVRGRVQESGELLDGAIESARLTGNVQAVAWNLFNRCEAHLAAGEISAALDVANESTALMHTLDDSAVAIAGSGSLLAALAESGEPLAALDVARSAAGGLDVPLIGGTWRVQRLEIVTRCLVATGDVDEAERIATVARELADSHGLPMPAAMASLAQGAVAFARGDAPAAAEHGQVAVARLQEAGMVCDTARALLFTGRAFGSAGAEQHAVDALQRALELFDSTGNRRRGAEAEQVLRGLGHHVHRRTEAGDRSGVGIGSLTAHEREIADLLVDRRTNAEIATQLFLSLKTVETHLRNIFRKLGVASRVEAARAVQRSDELLTGA